MNSLAAPSTGIPSPSLWEFITSRWSTLWPLAVEHVELIAVAIVLSALVGVVIGVLIWQRPAVAGAVLGTAAATLTIPSLALLAVFIPIFGRGWTPTLIALVLYAQLPIIRNTIAGLQSVDKGVLESAKGIGMAPRSVMTKIQLPLAWPIILTGLRVATMLLFGISAIAAYVEGPGLGAIVFTGLSRLGSVNSVNQALTGSCGIAILALLFDAAFLVVRRLTVSRGLNV